MSRPNRILIVMSSHADLGISGKRTGTWFEEVATPYYEFVDAGCQVVFASPLGGEAPIDHLSLQAPFTTANTDRFLSDPLGMLAIRETANWPPSTIATSRACSSRAATACCGTWPAIHECCA